MVGFSIGDEWCGGTGELPGIRRVNRGVEGCARSTGCGCRLLVMRFWEPPRWERRKFNLTGTEIEMRIAVRTMRRVAIVGGTLMLGLAAGCHVDTHKDGGNEDVKIATPFGGMSVKTNEQVVEGGVGLAVYPGAVLEKKDKGHDNGAADVNMSFGGFHLGVKALSYLSNDTPEKVTAFYRKDMARYGAVILCRDNRAVGKPDRTQDGLACDDDNNSHVHIHDDDSKGDELKAGSKLHQHIVGVDANGAGTKIGLIALDLPGKFSSGDSEDKQ